MLGRSAMCAAQVPGVAIVVGCLLTPACAAPDARSLRSDMERAFVRENLVSAEVLEQFDIDEVFDATESSEHEWSVLAAWNHGDTVHLTLTFREMKLFPIPRDDRFVDYMNEKLAEQGRRQLDSKIADLLRSGDLRAVADFGLESEYQERGGRGYRMHVRAYLGIYDAEEAGDGWHFGSPSGMGFGPPIAWALQLTYRSYRDEFPEVVATCEGLNGPDPMNAQTDCIYQAMRAGHFGS
jgi:hypothetical protein